MFLLDKLKRKKAQAAPVIETEPNTGVPTKRISIEPPKTKYCVTFIKKDNTPVSYYRYKEDKNSTATREYRRVYNWFFLRKSPYFAMNWCNDGETEKITGCTIILRDDIRNIIFEKTEYKNINTE